MEYVQEGTLTANHWAGLYNYCLLPLYLFYIDVIHLTKAEDGRDYRVFSACQSVFFLPD